MQDKRGFTLKIRHAQCDNTNWHNISIPVHFGSMGYPTGFDLIRPTAVLIPVATRIPEIDSDVSAHNLSGIINYSGVISYSSVIKPDNCSYLPYVQHFHPAV